MSKPVSEKQLAANRANAQRSTGPRTVEGKTRTRLNSLVHGLRSQDLLLPGEDQVALDQLRQSYLDQYQPAGPAELFCVEKMLQAHWRTRRVAPLETALLKTGGPLDIAFTSTPTPWDGFSRLSRYEAALERAYFRSLHELLQLQHHRIGFVSQDAPASQPVEEAPQADPPAPENGFARPTPQPEPAPEPPAPKYRVENGKCYRVEPDGTLTVIRRT